MTQPFRTPPRQIGFKPQQQRLSSVSAPRSPVSALAQRHGPAIRQHALQLQQWQTRAQVQQERVAKALSPSMKQMAEQQWQNARKEVARHRQALRQLRGEIRTEALGALPLLQDVTERPALHAALSTLYTETQPLLPDDLPPWLHWREQTLVAEPPDLTGQPLQALQPVLISPEYAALEELWKRWLPVLKTLLTEPAAVSAPLESTAPDDFEIISFVPEMPSAAPESQAPVAESFGEDTGPLELQFDFQSRRSLVRNQMGITLNQPKLSYQAYLDQGFAAIDAVAGTGFENLQPLFGAVESFLEAVSLDKSRYEAYFGLGYLYGLVRDLNHALYFLGVAFKISGDPTIQELIKQVRAGGGLGHTGG
ncbi:MAG: hypothetical protein ACO1RX_11795 [Candidatus Sericytochromatia bacterium]